MDGEPAPDEPAKPADPLDAAFEAEAKEHPGAQGLDPSPGVPKAWIVTNVKDWVMTELAKGSTQECRDAIEEAMTAAHDPGLDAKGKPKKDRPFFYMTLNGEPPEMNSEPFTSMAVTAFPAYCDIPGVASLATLEGARAVEIRKAKQLPQGYRVRVLHDADAEVDLEMLGDTLDFQSLYNMGYDLKGQPNQGGGSIAFTPDDAQQLRAADASAKFCEKGSAELAAALNEDGAGEILKRAVMYAGMRFCKQVLAETLKIEEDGGVYTSDGSRRRTPGGVFLKLLKEQVTDPQLRSIIFGGQPEFRSGPMSGSYEPQGIPINESVGEDDSLGSSLKADAIAFTPGGSAIPSATSPPVACTPPTASSLTVKAEAFVPGAN